MTQVAVGITLFIIVMFFWKFYLLYSKNGKHNPKIMIPGDTYVVFHISKTESIVEFVRMEMNFDKEGFIIKENGGEERWISKTHIIAIIPQKHLSQKLIDSLKEKNAKE